MEKKLRIGIVGTGHIGSTLTMHFTRAGHEVVIANSRGPETLSELARETGAKAVRVDEVPNDRDLIVITIPENKVPNLPKGFLNKRAEPLVVIDTGNYYPRQRDGRIEPIEDGMLESRWVEQHIGHPVVKVFNNIFADHLAKLGKPHGTPGRIALPVSGDDEQAKALVMELVDQIGFDPVDAGELDESWRQQPGTPVYTADLDATGVRRALSEATRERQPQWSATPDSPGTYDIPK